jgi:hypothetical protein
MEKHGYKLLDLADLYIYLIAVLYAILYAVVPSSILCSTTIFANGTGILLQLGNRQKLQALYSTKCIPASQPHSQEYSIVTSALDAGKKKKKKQLTLI